MYPGSCGTGIWSVTVLCQFPEAFPGFLVGLFGLSQQVVGDLEAALVSFVLDGGAEFGESGCAHGFGAAFEGVGGDFGRSSIISSEGKADFFQL